MKAQFGLLEGDFGREFLAEYNRKVESDYRNNKNLRVLHKSDRLVLAEYNKRYKSDRGQ